MMLSGLPNLKYESSSKIVDDDKPHTMLLTKLSQSKEHEDDWADKWEYMANTCLLIIEQTFMTEVNLPGNA